MFVYSRNLAERKLSDSRARESKDNTESKTACPFLNFTKSR